MVTSRARLLSLLFALCLACLVACMPAYAAQGASDEGSSATGHAVSLVAQALQDQKANQDADYAQEKAKWAKENADAAAAKAAAYAVESALSAAGATTAGATTAGDADVAPGTALATQATGAGYLESSYIKCYITDNGAFNIGTVDDDNLTYEFPGGDTSDVLVRIDGSDNFFDECASSTEISDDKTRAVSTATIEDVKVEQVLELVKSPGNSAKNMVKISIRCTNESNYAKKIGVRIMLDTMLGDNDGAPFIVSGREITTETAYSGLAIPRFYQALDSLYDPANTATGYLYYSAGEAPDKVQFAYWSEIRRASWNYSIDPDQGITGDSAVAVYFNESAVAPGKVKEVSTYYGAHASTSAEMYDPFNYSNSTYEYDLAVDCARYSALAYEDYKYIAGSDVYYNDKNSGKKYVKENDASEGLNNKLRQDNFKNRKSYNYKSPTEDTATYTLAHKKVNRNGVVRDLLLVVIRGTNKDEWRGNMCVTGTSYRNQDYHSSFFTGATMIESSIEKYVDKYNMQQPLVLITGHSRGGAVGNILARELTSSDSYGEERLDCVDPNGIFAYLFAVPNVQTDYCTMLNIYNFCFRDDFVPSMPLYTKWGYFKNGRTWSATAETAKSKNEAFKLRSTISMQASMGFNSRKDGAKFDATATKNVIVYVGKKWKNIKAYYDQKIKKGTADSLFDFMYNTVAPAAQLQAGGVVGMVGSAFFGNKTGTDCGPIANFFLNGRSTYINDTHHMCNYYNALVTGVFKEVETNADSTYVVPKQTAGMTTLSVQADDEVDGEGEDEGGESVIPLDEAESAALVAFANQGQNAEQLQSLEWDPADPSTWEGVGRDDDGRVESLSLGTLGLEGQLDLSAFTSLTSVDVSYNQLSGLVLPDAQASVLQMLVCNDNQLSELDIAGQPLQNLDCANNYLDVDAIAAAWAEIVAAASDDDETELCASYEPQNAPADTPYNSGDVAALKAILTNAELWDISDDADPANWEGVSWELVDGQMRVVALELGECELSGVLDVSALTELVDLSCAGNELTEIDASGCSKLAFLNACNNLLAGIQLSADAELESLSVANNFLSSAFTQTLTAQTLNVGFQGIDADKASFDSAELDVLTGIAEQRGCDVDKPGTWGFVSWELAEGVYHASALNLSATGSTVDEDGNETDGAELQGTLDLSGFAHLTSLDCSSTAVEEVVLPESITAVSESAFYDCADLTQVVLPEGVKSVDEGAFSGCTSLAEIELPSGLESIGAEAFAECSQLEYLVIPETIETIGEGAFKLCQSLSAAYFVGDAPSCGQDAFMYANPGFCIYYKEDAAGWDDEAWDAYAKAVLQNLAVSKLPEKINYEIGESFDSAGMELLLFDGSKLSVLTEGYEVDAPAFDEPGDYQVNVSAGGYSTALGVQVLPHQITDADVQIEGPLAMTGSALTPKPTVMYDGELLEEGRDYELAYYDNVYPGWASCEIKGIGLYGGIMTVDFYIEYRPINPDKVVKAVSQLASGHNYDDDVDYLWKFAPSGSGIKTITVVFDKRCKLESGYDTVYFYNADGSAAGEYTGTELAGKTLTFKGSAMYMRLVTDSSTAEWGVAATGYYVNGVVPKAPGKAAVAKLSRLKKGFSVKAKKVTGASGYQVRYSLKKNMKSAKSAKAAKPTIKVSGLKAKKTYYVQVRAYKNTTMGVKYGSWSAKKKVKTK